MIVKFIVQYFIWMMLKVIRFFCATLDKRGSSQPKFAWENKYFIMVANNNK